MKIVIFCNFLKKNLSHLKQRIKLAFQISVIKTTFQNSVSKQRIKSAYQISVSKRPFETAVNLKRNLSLSK